MRIYENFHSIGKDQSKLNKLMRLSVSYVNTFWAGMLKHDQPLRKQHVTDMRKTIHYSLHYTGSLMSTLANSEDPDEMPHNAAFHQGLHCLLDKNDLKRKTYYFIWIL